MGGLVDKAEQLLVVFFEAAEQVASLATVVVARRRLFRLFASQFLVFFFLALALALDSSVLCVWCTCQQLLQQTVCVAPMMTQFERHP